MCAIVAELRENAFLKRPGVAETLDWARAVAELRAPGDDSDISAAEIERTIGTLLKEAEDVQRVDSTLLERLERAAREAREATDGDETPTAGTESPVEPSADDTSDR